MTGSIAAIIVLRPTRDAHACAAEIQADAWLAKPFHLEALFACIKQHAGEPSVRLVGVL
jgi:DNA-binding response OmpR family regulator